MGSIYDADQARSTVLCTALPSRQATIESFVCNSSTCRELLRARGCRQRHVNKSPETYSLRRVLDEGRHGVELGCHPLCQSHQPNLWSGTASRRHRPREWRHASWILSSYRPRLSALRAVPETLHTASSGARRDCLLLFSLHGLLACIRSTVPRTLAIFHGYLRWTRATDGRGILVQDSGRKRK